ncbi:MAG: glutamate-semialdehyde -aminomutase [Clostridia bacterium]|nr:glutamate-semialdehyde -aminomutase [Clostridia bacterium]
MNHTHSESIYEEAIQYIPGGVNSPVRAFKSVGINPIFVERAEGSKIYDVDGNEYIDYICSWGPLILGHGNEHVLRGIEEQLKKGTSYGVPTLIEVEMAKLIVDAYKGIDKVRMVNSGTEATMSALRAARAYTGRNKILKFEGCYHGHSDALLVKSGSGTITYGVPTSPGVPEDVIKHTLVCRYNDMDEVRAIFKEHGEDIACVIVETVSGNMGLVPGKKEFLQLLRDITHEYHSVLIFDEVITGFRLGYGSSPEYFGIEPDMACFGKIIGGGLPVGAYGGKNAIMDMISPVGPVYQAGTLSGNPLAMYAGKNTLEYLRDHRNVYDELDQKASVLEQGIRNNLKKLGLNLAVTRVGSLIGLFFISGKTENYDDVKECDLVRFNIYFKEMLQRGILIGPAQFEAMFVSTAHSKEDIEKTIEANYEALKCAYQL